MATRVTPETILSQLRELWTSLAKPTQTSGEPGVLRSCTMTLIVVTDEPEGDNLEATLAELMQSHPSRTIVVRLAPGETPRLEAGVRAHCWRPFGSRQQICCELIAVKFSGQRLEGAVNLLQGLLVPDLPVALWVRSRLPANAPQFQPFLPLARRVIVDSMLATDPSSAIETVRRLKAGGLRIADLAWTRLTPWRKMTADLFDAFECRSRLDSITNITITHLGHQAPASALYLGAWLASGLPGRPAVEYRTAKPDATGEPPQGSLRSVVMSAADFQVVLRVADTAQGVRQIELRAGALESHRVLPAYREASLMADELQVTGVDHHFERTLRAA
ncbi:MAG: glucose-6-phosphate dehydrogenase assembly protein OpcA [Bryobacterales bacterium]|nr:glucose-6-phosphate dehydrogenase assembly protein OpcA [Bryobacterales bacterium]